MPTFFVEGKPAPQGSKTAKCINGRAIMWESSLDVKPWRNAIVKQALTHEPMPEDAALEVVLQFNLAKPKTVKRSHPTVKPDLDKLVRSTLDGLKPLLGDDAQVVAIAASKTYAEPQGCWIDVRVADV